MALASFWILNKPKSASNTLSKSADDAAMKLAGFWAGGVVTGGFRASIREIKFRRSIQKDAASPYEKL
jgi:hypothetical protein